MSISKILTIAGSDSGGGAGIQADLKTIAALGGFGMTVITALTAQNTIGVFGIHEVPAEFIEKQFDAVAEDIGIDAAKTGMLANEEIVNTVTEKVIKYEIRKLVVDPVMVAKGGAMLIKEDAKKALIENLLPLAFVVTPNIPEAEVISGLSINGVEDMKTAAETIYQMGAQNVLIKGGHLPGDARDFFYDGVRLHEFSQERIVTEDTHGTGCTLSAAIATGLAQGMSAYEAVSRAKRYITTAIRFSLRLGAGHGPANHMAAIFRESSRYRCLEELREAVSTVKDAKCGNLIPEIQSNFVYALPFAVNKNDVAGIPGRIVRVGEKAETLHDPAFGASNHMARIVLTVMRYNKEYRSAMDIRFSEKLAVLCR
ncbi:MAG: bifunctional hydroxymethylpyrimidine kinase/phosphomethylpyrimidine kinase, partial [Syntrophales bacterium]|nr:bifunctional hydroxymethylpyrimidine kinase/phosphomethylpyrimidine kinase [Syntrophales bacterium]